MPGKMGPKVVEGCLATIEGPKEVGLVVRRVSQKPLGSTTGSSLPFKPALLRSGTIDEFQYCLLGGFHGAPNVSLRSSRSSNHQTLSSPCKLMIEEIVITFTFLSREICSIQPSKRKNLNSAFAVLLAVLQPWGVRAMGQQKIFSWAGADRFVGAKTD